MSKYELTTTTKVIDGVTYYQIKALRDIPERHVVIGDVGGWLAKPTLSHEGISWVDKDSVIGPKVVITKNAWIETSELYGVLSIGDEVRIQNSKIDGGIFGSISDKVVIKNSQVYSQAICLYKSIQILGTRLQSNTLEVGEYATVIDSIIFAEKITILDIARCVNAEIDAKEVEILSCAKVTQSQFKGNSLHLNKMSRLIKSKIITEQLHMSDKTLIKNSATKIKHVQISGHGSLQNVSVYGASPVLNMSNSAKIHGVEKDELIIEVAAHSQLKDNAAIYGSGLITTGSLEMNGCGILEGIFDIKVEHIRITDFGCVSTKGEEVTSNLDLSRVALITV